MQSMMYRMQYKYNNTRGHWLWRARVSASLSFFSMSLVSCDRAETSWKITAARGSSQWNHVQHVSLSGRFDMYSLLAQIYVCRVRWHDSKRSPHFQRFFVSLMGVKIKIVLLILNRVAEMTLSTAACMKHFYRRHRRGKVSSRFCHQYP